MKKLLLFLTCLMTSLFVFPQIAFERTYGGTGYDNGLSVLQTSDGGYAILGITNSSLGSPNDIYLIKTNAYGDTLWNKTYGGSENDLAMKIIKTFDGGYIVVGTTASFGNGGFDILLIKLDAFFNTNWTKTIGGASSEYGNNIIQTCDSGYIIAGNKHSLSNNDDWYIVKINNLGDTIWTKTYDYAGYDDWGFSAAETSDGGFVITGVTQTWQETHAQIIKLNSNGALLWSKNYDSAGDWACSIYKTNDGGFIISGSSTGNINNAGGILLIKTNADGDTIWTRVYGNPNWGQGVAVAQTNDGGYLTCGYLDLMTGNRKAYIIKTDIMGDTIWTRLYGNDFETNFQSFDFTNDGGYIFTGYQEVSHEGPYDVYLVKTDANGIVGLKEEIININNFNIYPNPATSKITIYIPQQFGQTKTLEVYDCIGQLQLVQTDRFTEIDISNLTNGLYFLVLTNTDNERQTMKIIKN